MQSTKKLLPKPGDQVWLYNGSQLYTVCQAVQRIPGNRFILSSVDEDRFVGYDFTLTRLTNGMEVLEARSYHRA